LLGAFRENVLRGYGLLCLVGLHAGPYLFPEIARYFFLKRAIT
jgi:hypothetical protein